MVDNPTHLADFGAALTSADSAHLQAVLESKDVSQCFITTVFSCICVMCCILIPESRLFSAIIFLRVNYNIKCTGAITILP